MPDLLTVDQGAEATGISRATIFRMIRAGELVRYEKRGSTATMIDRRQLERPLRPRAEK